jgi:capsular exopolysaccharide synthesis family protein
LDNNDNRDPDIKQQYGITPYNNQNVANPVYMRYPEADLSEEVHLRDYIHVILKRKWIVLIFFISIVVITTALTFMITPIYKSTVILKIDKESPDVFAIKGFSRSGGDLYETQYELLKSRTLAGMVIKKLNLDKNKDFLPVEDKLSVIINSVTDPIINTVSNVLSVFSSKDEVREKVNLQPYLRQDDVLKPDDVPIYLINLLTARLEVTPVKLSQLVNVSFLSHNPKLSMDIANAVGSTYIDYDLFSRIEANSKAKDFLEKQIEITKTKIDVSEKALNGYAAKNTIVFLDGDKQSVGSQKLAAINSALSNASTERMKIESLYKQIKESGAENPAILNDPLLMGLKRDHASLESEYSNLSRTFTPDFPKMKNLKTQIDFIYERIEKEKRNLTRSLESEYNTAKKKEATLKDAFEVQQRKSLDFQERAVQYQTLKREVDVNKELHNNLLQKLNEVGVATMSKATNIQVVDRAVYPNVPFKPNKMRNFLLSVVFGIMGGVGLAFLVEYFDNTVKDTQEIEKTMNVPSLGMIPHQPELNAENRPKIVYSDSTNPISEAFRSIGTFILLSSSTKPPKTILVTSPGQKEGKTTICINIALALAESLGNGIIIDADLRKPRLHNSFELDNKTGLSSYLSGNIEFEGSNGKLIKPTSISGLSVITSGHIPPNPAQLLFSARMKDLLDALYIMYNFVIIDAPPVMGMPDSVLLSRIVDGTILVVKAGETQRETLSATKKIFSDVNTSLLGVVLNGVKKQDLKYGYYSNYFSSYFKE